MNMKLKPTFSNNWASKLRRTLQKDLLPLRDMPMKYLEIGVYEGHSMYVMLKTFLLHPDSMAYGIDPWEIAPMNAKRFPRNEIGEAKIKSIEDRARANLEPFGSKAVLIKARSSEYLSTKPFPNESLDVIYIDGVHEHEACLNDSHIAWDLLKYGGFMVWDDVMARTTKGQIKRVVEEIIKEKGAECIVLKMANQALIKKVKIQVI